MAPKSICLLPQIQAVSGPASFQLKLKAELERRGYPVHHDVGRTDRGAILIIAGTRHVSAIAHARRRGIRIVQRLDGMNWIQRRKRSGVRYFVRAELGNLLLAYTRRFLADFVVYQSNFTRTWWEKVYGKTPVPNTVIYNGVDLDQYSPAGIEQPPAEHIRIQVVEGHLKGGNEIGLEFAVDFAVAMQRQSLRQVELVVTADVPSCVRTVVQQRGPDAWVTYTGVVAREQIPAMNRSAHAFFSAELNAACPNSVIEALACGTPVLAFDAGSLPELVQGEAGRVVPYGSDPWRLQAPDYPALAQAAMDVMNDQKRYRVGARARAEQAFGLGQMADHYLQVFDL